MKNPVVTIEMENGDIMKAELYPEIAPNTVNNFISLIKKGFYDGLIFHRVIKGFMIQADARMEMVWAVQGIPSRVSSARMVLRTISSTPRAFSLWRVRWTELRRFPVLHHA